MQRNLNKGEAMIPIIITYLLNIFDYICTTYWAKKYGVEIESNPIGRWLFEHNVAWLFKIVIIGIICLAMVHFYNTYEWLKYAVYALLGVYSAITAYHLFILLYTI